MTPHPSPAGSGSRPGGQRPDDPVRLPGPKNPAVNGHRKVRVLLADDHEILREGLAALLAEEPDLELVGQASDGQTAVELALRIQPDVVVMDVSMPRLSGIEATRRIKAALPSVRVIGLSMHEQTDMAAAMREAGASAYLPKGESSHALIEAIRGGSSAPPAAQ